MISSSLGGDSYTSEYPARGIHFNSKIGPLDYFRGVKEDLKNKKCIPFTYSKIYKIASIRS